MHRDIKEWTIDDFRNNYHTIDYPEFQRESTVWGIRQKNLLIDSIFRGFDIGNIYLVINEDKSTGKYYSCVDGRQRLNAIFSFIGINESDRKHNNFEFSSVNEVVEENGDIDELVSQKYVELPSDYKSAFDSYPLKVVLLSNINEEYELNLQFQRLQVAQILNGAEKLNAMLGEMRDTIFGDNGLGEEDYFKLVGTRNTRYGPQQSASQVMINAVYYKKEKHFHRARFIDMQEFFKDYYKLDVETQEIVENISYCSKKLTEALGEEILKKIKNRALVVTILLFYYIQQYIDKEVDLDNTILEEFITYILGSLAEITKKPNTELDTTGPLERLQLAITQASVERYAIEERHKILTAEYKKFNKS